MEIQRIGSEARKIVSDLEPTPKQLALLSRLAYRQGSSYAVPVTRRQAHDEIERLLRERKSRSQRRRRHTTPNAL
jgi:CelD/BcsL family acetyltransferase involved in cellulose biosynthesis